MNRVAVDTLETRPLEAIWLAGAEVHLALLLTLSAAGSLLVFGLAVAAYRRRRSRPYLLITAALGALVARPMIGASTFFDVISMNTHHTIEHLLDVVIAALLIGAVYSVGTLERERSPDETDGRIAQPPTEETRSDGGVSEPHKQARNRNRKNGD